MLLIVGEPTRRAPASSTLVTTAARSFDLRDMTSVGTPSSSSASAIALPIFSVLPHMVSKTTTAFSSGFCVAHFFQCSMILAQLSPRQMGP